MLNKKFKYLALIFFLLPEILMGYCTVGLWDPPGWWGHFDYLFIWRKERFFPPLVSTGTLGEGGVLLFGDSFEGGNPHSGFRFDGGIWCCDNWAFGGSVILIGNDPVTYSQNTDNEPLLARPFFNADPLVDAPDSLELLPYGEINVKGTNHFFAIEGYARCRLVEGSKWAFDGVAGPLYLRLQDNLDVDSFGSDSFLVRISDHFDCSNSFYAGMVGAIAEYVTSCWRMNVWGQLGIGNMVKETLISGDRDTLLFPQAVGFLALPSNIGRHNTTNCEVVPLCGADLNLKICSGIHLSIGYLFIYLPRIALAGNQVDLNIDLTQTVAEPEFLLRTTDFWFQGFSLGISVYY